VSSLDPWEVGRGSPDPSGAGHASLDSWEGSPILPDPKGARPPLGEGANPTEAHSTFTTTDIKARTRVTLPTLERSGQAST
jgi:hypothetical protein